MGNLYHIDMGYDWDAVGSFPLQWAVVLVQTVNGVQTGSPAFISNIKNGDQVMFFLYDLTGFNDGTPANPATVPTLSITQGGSITQWMSSSAADSKTTGGWPFDQTTQNLVNGGVCSLAAGAQSFGSTAFPGGQWPCWAVQAPNFNVTPAALQLLTANVTTNGSFNLTFAVQVSQTVAGTTTTRLYSVDPEMVVTSGSGNEPPGGGGS